mmetsp:Transcript_24792/g.64340  ORF Transcript_24792/g.64340 Transcript_24792/m.64340 type:complete len:487 (-) Transcript_24792:2691-4151(-)
MSRGAAGTVGTDSTALAADPVDVREAAGTAAGHLAQLPSEPDVAFAATLDALAAVETGAGLAKVASPQATRLAGGWTFHGARLLRRTAVGIHAPHFAVHLAHVALCGAFAPRSSHPSRGLAGRLTVAHRALLLRPIIVDAAISVNHKPIGVFADRGAGAPAATAARAPVPVVHVPLARRQSGWHLEAPLLHQARQIFVHALRDSLHPRGVVVVQDATREELVVDVAGVEHQARAAVQVGGALLTTRRLLQHAVDGGGDGPELGVQELVVTGGISARQDAHQHHMGRPPVGICAGLRLDLRHCRHCAVDNALRHKVDFLRRAIAQEMSWDVAHDVGAAHPDNHHPGLQARNLPILQAPQKVGGGIAGDAELQRGKVPAQVHVAIAIVALEIEELHLGATQDDKVALLAIRVHPLLVLAVERLPQGQHVPLLIVAARKLRGKRLPGRALITGVGQPGQRDFLGAHWEAGGFSIRPAAAFALLLSEHIW